MKNLIQYASFLVAVGCTLNYDSNTAQLDIAEFPKEAHKAKAIQAAIADIERFLDTANFSDGMAAIHLADLVDGRRNPLSADQRQDALNALGIMRMDRFVSNVMMTNKANRSWHVSEKPNTCTVFGKVCTHRGVIVDPRKRGIRGSRLPEDYHVPQGNGTKREQLVTPALDAAYDLIPDGMLISPKSQVAISSIEQQIESLKPTELSEFIRKLQERQAALNSGS